MLSDRYKKASSAMVAFWICERKAIFSIRPEIQPRYGLQITVRFDSPVAFSFDSPHKTDIWKTELHTQYKAFGKV